MLLAFLLSLACSAQFPASWLPAAAPDKGAVTATLVAEATGLRPGQPLAIGVHLRMAKGWSIYWRNPGYGGVATTVQWRLPDGFTVGPLQWPYPHRKQAPTLPGEPPGISYGYEDEVLLLATITPPVTLPVGEKVLLEATAEWVGCSANSCVPRKETISLTLPVVDEAAPPAPETAALFAKYRARLPVTSDLWTIAAGPPASGIWPVFVCPPPGRGAPRPAELHFLPAINGVLNDAAPQPLQVQGECFVLSLSLAPQVKIGALPLPLPGILLGPPGWLGMGTGEALEVALTPGAPPALAGPGAAPVPPPARGAGPTVSAGTPLWVLLLLALAGGLVLNLMPCVLPVLSLKVLGFVRQAEAREQRPALHGLVFTLGVLVSFWLLGGLVLVLKAVSGRQFGWGFQMQSPVFVAVMAMLFLAFALCLFGVVEIGASLTSVGGGLTGRRGLAGSFFSGVLMTVIATPCTGPLVGPALAAALTQPPATALAVFTMLGLGLALPYLLLSLFPGLLRFVPKPGAWMESLKQFFGFLLLLFVVDLLDVLANQVGAERVGVVLLGLVIVAAGVWVVGRWGTLLQSSRTRWLGRAVAALLVLAGGWLAVRDLGPAPARPAGIAWETYSDARLATLRAAGTPVFIDFSAKWCLTCRANEFSFDVPEVGAALKRLGIVALKADWTKRDDQITAALAQYDRASVPLYVLYGRTPNAPPQLLPQLLRKGTLLGYLEQLK